MRVKFFIWASVIFLFFACSKTNEKNSIKLGESPTAPSTEFKKENYATLAETMPQLIGGLQSIQSKVKYPEEALKKGIEGTVYAVVYVNENGGVDHAEIVKGIGYGCDEEVLKAVSQAKFTPAYSQGKPVKVKVIIPVRFKLNKN
ncbi:energy transducer TonB [Candidatus Chrysopegis kryptomonas]|jgi:protein TonB|uniref:TonB family C-terminal domain-containing protein n=1 Tax=Candidatus Chryseopegocella kryptomonas TaxID=1633643 RepID=A0A0P1MZP6_9BACT|nr:energy transducer TonB [Candidatus Chrysopegis kryptomonas]CUT01688.1 TonB family C-terminal domain-containing protein [Candidatus Chrysopegis kryptomonas]